MTRFRAQSSVLLTAAACVAFASCGGGGGGDGGGGGGGPLSITTTIADDGVVGSAYSESIFATGGQGAKSFTISAGALPAGLTLGAGGVISGTPAGPAGTSNFTVSVTDSAATPATDTQALAIDVVEPLVIETAVVPNAAIGDDYSEPIVVVGGTVPYSFGLTGSPPSGLHIDASGTLNGTIAQNARTGDFAVEVTDSSNPALIASGEYKIVVDMEIATAELVDAAGGVEYTDSLDTRGGLPPFTWQILAGSLPAGLAMSPEGIISGTPDPVCAESTSILQVQATDSDAPVQTDVRGGIDLRLVPTYLHFDGTPLPTGLVGVPYSYQFVYAGGIEPYNFTLDPAATLPSGLSLDAAGLISGTPDTVEFRGIRIYVSDSCGFLVDNTFSITILADAPGRNDSIATATVLPGDGTYQASISPSGHPNTVFDPDEDFYAITTAAQSTITVDINAVVNGSPLDSVIEILGSNGVRLASCGSPAFNSTCMHDDEDTDNGDLDSILQVRVAGGTTIYIHVVDWGSNARPDKLYDLVVSGVN
jgi:hypothetical protein